MIARSRRQTVLRATSFAWAAGLACSVAVAASDQSSLTAQQPVQPAAQANAIPTADRPPAALEQVADSAALLFDALYASDWEAAGDYVQALREFVAALPTTLPKPDLVAELRSQIQYAVDGVSGRERLEAMDAANRITRLVADLSAEFQRAVPYEAVMLGYYGRQLELGLASQQPNTLKRAATDLRSAWNRLEPQVERRGHVNEARQFTDIVVTLEGARRPADFVRPTRAERVAADRIVAFFRSST